MTEKLITLSRDNKVNKISSSFSTWKKMWLKKAKGERIFLWIMMAFMIIYGLTLLFPLFWALINSFKSQTEYYDNKFGLPNKWTLVNYQNISSLLANTSSGIVESFFNSIWMSTLSTFLGIFASCLTSYVTAKYRFKASGLIYGAAVFIQIIPIVGAVAGMYNLIWGVLGIENNPFLIWPIWFGGFGFSFLMLYGSFKSVSWSYAESAFIDGAGHFRTFIQIMLPQVKPVLASLFIVNFIGAWNDYMTAYLYMPDFPPLALSVYTLGQNNNVSTNIPAYLTIIVLSIIPTLILFISFQKMIMENTTTGGLKG